MIKDMTEKSISIRAVLIALFLVISVAAAAVSPITAEASSNEAGGTVNALSYKMSLKLDTKADSLSETVVIRFRNETDKPVSQIYIRDMTPAALRYYKKNYAGSANTNVSTKIRSIRLKGSKKNLKYKSLKGKTVLVVRLGKGRLMPGETGSVVVRMKTDIPDRQDRFGFQKTKKGKLYTLSFCFPYLADNKNGKWNTDPYFDDGESRSSDLANYYVSFKAPKSYTVAATGDEVTRRGVSRITAKGYRDFAIVASNFMKKDSFKVNGIKVNNYYLNGGHHKQYRRLSKMVAADSIKLFSKKIGKYAYKELDMVECLFGFGFGGMEYPGLVMINGSTYLEGKGNKFGAQSLAEVVTHEIGHQWFYAAVGNREYAEAWIDEGFTSFLEKDVYGLTDNKSNRYLRKVDKYVPSIKSLKKDQAEFLKLYKKENKGDYLNISPSKYPKTRYYGSAEYDGGYLFLVDVKNIMGEDKFYSFIREYYDTYFMKTVKTKEIVKLIRKYDNSEEMNKAIRFFIKE